MKTLDINKKHDVVYCIPTWLRDEQIKHAISRVKGRIQQSNVLHDDPIAVVCYGPSLNDTWEKLKEFKHIITCSGSHKFLLERGIVPTYHCDVDPRPHKVDLMGPPHKDVEYLISSTCHPKLFDHLEGYNVKLWHVFDGAEEGIRALPAGEWALTGGSSVGLRALTIARFLGYRDMHIFGMDGSIGKSGSHADHHPMSPKDACVVEYGGTQYHTITSYLECAKQVFHELNQLPDVRATFYGDGLVQAMSRDYRRGTPNSLGTIAFIKPVTISDDYRKLNAQLHRDNLAYGVGGGKHAATVLKLAESLNTRSILDYGCGKGYLAKEIPFPIWEYDPAIPGKDESPRPADLVVCTDVLEHIEPETLEAVLQDLARCIKKIGFFVIHTGPAQKCYADGRNTHLIQKGRDWWDKILSKYFTVGKIIAAGKELHVVVAPRPAVKAKNTLIKK